MREKNEYRVREIMEEQGRQVMARLSEFRRDIAESKEYINQMHNEVDRLDRARKRDRADIIA